MVLISSLAFINSLLVDLDGYVKAKDSAKRLEVTVGLDSCDRPALRKGPTIKHIVLGYFYCLTVNLCLLHVDSLK